MRSKETAAAAKELELARAAEERRRRDAERQQAEVVTVHAC
jgi:hypothetical protein